MESNKLDYANVIADLEAKIAALQSLAASFRAAQASGALGQSGDVLFTQSNSSSSEPIELPVGALLDKSLPAAVKMLLGAVKRKMTNKEIANALREHGVESTSGNFEGVVSGAIKRLGDAGELLRFKDGWGLAELYPEHLRSKITQEKKPIAKRSKTKRSAKTKTASTKDSVPTVKAPKQPAVGVEAQIEKFLNDNGPVAVGKFTATDIATVVNAHPVGVTLALGRMAAKGKIEKTPDGKYQLPHTLKPTLKAV